MAEYGFWGLLKVVRWRDKPFVFLFAGIILSPLWVDFSKPFMFPHKVCIPKGEVVLQ